jgi:hypothetical protein
MTKPDVADTVAVIQLLSRYCHIVDASEWERLPELFTSDAVFDATQLGQPLLDGLDAITAAFLAATPDQRALAHVSATPLVESGADGLLRVTSSWSSVSPRGQTVGGRFVDEIVPTAGDWRFRRRVATRTWRAATPSALEG